MTEDVDLSGELPGLIYEKRDHIAYITLNRPERSNALHASMIGPIRAIWAEIRDDPWIRATVVTAAGERHFCTGADMGAVATRGGVSASKGPLTDEVLLVPTPEPRYGSRPSPPSTAPSRAQDSTSWSTPTSSWQSDHATFVDTHVNVGMVGAIENIGLTKRMPLGTALRMTLSARSTA